MRSLQCQQSYRRNSLVQVGPRDSVDETWRECREVFATGVIGTSSSLGASTGGVFTGGLCNRSLSANGSCGLSLLLAEGGWP